VPEDSHLYARADLKLREIYPLAKEKIGNNRKAATRFMDFFSRFCRGKKPTRYIAITNRIVSSEFAFGPLREL